MNDFTIVLNKDPFDQYTFCLIILLASRNLNPQVLQKEKFKMIVRNCISNFSFKEQGFEDFINKSINDSELLFKFLTSVDLTKLENLDTHGKYSALLIQNEAKETILRFDLGNVRNLDILNINPNLFKNYKYSFHFKDDEHKFDSSKLDLSLIQILLSAANLWHGEIEILPQIQKFVSIEDKSSDANVNIIKTISEAYSIQVLIKPFNFDSDGNIIATAKSQKAVLSINNVSDIYKTNEISNVVSFELGQRKENQNVIPASVFTTKIQSTNKLFNQSEDFLASIRNLYNSNSFEEGNQSPD